MRIQKGILLIMLLSLLTLSACGLREPPEAPVAETDSHPVAVASIYEMELPVPMYNIDCYAISDTWLYLADNHYDKEKGAIGCLLLQNGIFETYAPAIRIEEMNLQPLALIPGRNGECFLFGKKDGGTEATFFLNVYNEEGTLLRHSDYSPQELQNLGESLTNGQVTEDGRLYLYTYGSNGTVFSFDTEGNPEEIYTPGLECLEGVVIGRDNQVYGYYLTGEEPLFAELGTTKEQPVSCSIRPDRVFGGYENGLYLSTSEGFWQFDPETEETSLLWEWDDDYIQLDGNELDQVFCNGDNLYLLFYDQYENSGKITEPLTIAQVSFQDSQNYPAKQLITLGTVYDFNINTHVRDLVQLYNRQSSKYRVELITYEKPETLSSKDAFDELELQLLRGEGPDLMELTGLYADSLASQGAFEELDTYYRSSDKIQKELLDCVRNAGVVRGRNILVIPSFYIQSLISKEEIPSQEWTPTYFLELAGNEKLFQFESSSSALTYCMGIRYGEHFIDYEKKECYFDSAEFISLLEQCASLESVEMPLTYTTPALKEADFMMKSARLSCSEDYLDIAYQNGDIYWVGRPGWEGMENEMYPTEAFAMNSASSNKDGAWDFLEFLLSRELQEKIDWGFPSRKDCFETYLQSSYYAEDYHAEDFSVTFSTPWARELTEEDFAVIRNLAETSVFQTWGSNTNPIKSIVMEEANMYFSGDATIEETVRKIQSRISLYLQEM